MFVPNIKIDSENTKGLICFPTSIIYATPSITDTRTYERCTVYNIVVSSEDSTVVILGLVSTT